jgi:hypothetical protein
MKPRTVLLAASAVIALVLPRVAMAQYPVGGHSDNPNGPTVSPYLNLLNINSQGFSSYQTMVKPIVDQQNALQRQGSAIQRLQNQAGGGGRATGHATYFMNYSHFYTAHGGRAR